MAYSSSPSRNWTYDVFPSFFGEDVRVTFLSHFLKELDRKLIFVFKDYMIEKGESMDHVLKQAIRTSKIAVVVFSEKYSSSSWCLNELAEIVKCKEEYGQEVIPVFYGLDPSHVRKQTGNFGQNFAKTCKKKTDEEIKLWRQSLTEVANISGYCFQDWPYEAKMIEAIGNNIWRTLILKPQNDFEEFVGMEDHIAKMSDLLDLKSKDVRMVGIWGSSGIGKTSIARVLYSEISHRFQDSIFINSTFVSNNMKIFEIANPDDNNVKIQMVKSLLFKIFEKKDVTIDSLDAIEERLRHHKILIFIDDLDNQIVLETLLGQTQWFGGGSRIIVITKDKHFLKAHEIDYIYEVSLPSNKLAFKMFCRYAFKQFFPPDGLMELASEIALCAGNLPLGLKVLGSYLKGIEKKDLMDMLPWLRNVLDGKVESILRLSYDGLGSQKDKTMFCHIACLFNGENVNDIKLLLQGSNLDVSIVLKNLVDKSLIHIREGVVEMHSLLRKMGRKIVHAQSKESGKQEFLINTKHLRDVLENNTDTKQVLGILDIDEIAIKKMRNLRFLNVDTKKKRLTTRKRDEEKNVKWHLPGFDNFVHILRLITLDRYLMINMPSIRPKNFTDLEKLCERLQCTSLVPKTSKGLKGTDLKDGKKSKSSTTMVTDKRLMPQDLVFINFWGEEVHCSFISHLVYAFSREGVNISIRKYEKKGEDLGNTLQIIEDSNIALVIFSSRYTESRWCLEDLVKIYELEQEGRLPIIPIFYKVEPSQVKQLEGDYGLKLWNLWSIHRDPRIIKWKHALESVASREGLCLKDHSSESKFITSIVEKVLRNIHLREGENTSLPSKRREKTPKFYRAKGEKHESFLDKCPLFGLEHRMKQLEQKLEFDCNETRIIGVVGMTGIGKTTLAMMLHEKWNCKFVRCAAFLGIDMKSEKWLRKTLLQMLLGEKFQVINDETTHKSMKNKLLKTKVFVVLDDVSNKKQLEFLLDNLNWIKNGSKVVITARDKSLIEGFVHDTYVVPPLNYGEALQLFSYHAFGDHVFDPTVTLTEVFTEFLVCAGGNPLVIKLLGKQLRGKDEAQWEMSQGGMADLGMMSLDIFKLSFDELSEKEKNVFLDIACFFRSENDYFVRSLLDPGDHNATDTESVIRDLTHKCMIAISDFRVEMNGLIYMFGKIYSSQALIEENGGESRLWYTQEIIDALVNQKDTKIMRGIFLDMAEVTEGMVLHRLTFIHMINLRYLKIYDSCCPRSCKAVSKLHFPDGLEFPLENVRYLHWEKFPLEELPSDFRPENLVDLRLPYSMVEHVWQGVKDTPQLKWVDLSHSSKLLTLSELAKAESLQKLNLEGCTNLDELPGKMQNMKSLVYLNLKGCIRLSSLPKMNLISLKTLILSNCSNLKEFQVISRSLEVLHLDGTAIKKLHPSIKTLQRLVLFNMKNCKMLESLPNCLGQLKALEELILSGCSRLKNLLDVRQSMKHVKILLLDGIGATEMPKISCFAGSEGQATVDMVLQPSGSYPSDWPRGFDGVYLLQRLCLSGNDFVSLQNDIGKLYNLTWLDVKHCKKLRSVPVLPPRLQYFDAHGCDSLEKVGNPLAILVLTEQVHAIFNFSNCNKLDQDAQDSIISYTRRRSQLMLGALSRYNGGFTLEPLARTCFPGWEIPEWFSHRGSGSVIEPKLPPHWCDNRLTGIALCAVILCAGDHEQRNSLLVNCNCKFENADGSSIHFSCTVGGWNKHNNTPQKMEFSHVFIGFTSRLDISKQVGYDEERCFCTKSSFEFQVTDGTENVVGCEVLQCGFSLVYATHDRENICLDAKTLVVPKTVKSFPGEETSSDDDIQCQYENLHSERRSNAKKTLRKSFENKRFNVFNKNPGGEIIISSNHHNTPTEDVEKPYLVGAELRLKQLEKVLYSTPGKTRIVGVIGMPGFGKTTLANILFEKRGCKFPRSFFLTISKENYSEELERKYLGELLEKSKNISAETKDESSKDNPLQTKFFVVLDDVSEKNQLEFLLGKLNWIKKGSKIVVTASDKSLVEGLVHETYVVPHLNSREAFQVFSYHAFGGKLCNPTGTFLSLSNLFVHNVGGNPLALELLGSELCGKDEAYWKHKLQTTIQNSNTNIQDVWRFYTDQLTERQKEVLLDIACFFRSEDQYFVRSLLDSGDPDSTDSLSEVRGLAEKFLITICDGRVEMDDRLYTFCKDFGSPRGLRLWNYEDILDKLRETEHLEASALRGIFVDMSQVTRSIALERTTFINMCDLRYLKIYESCCPRKDKSDCKLQFPDGLDFSLEEVRYFHWLKFPLEELPPDFRPENLVDLRLPYSNIRFLWKGVKDTPRLKWVDLSYSGQLLNLSGLAKAESLQRLNLEGCLNLNKLPEEMRNMKFLVYLNMRGCMRLRSLPKMNLISLKTLILSDCSNLEEFQVISKSLESLYLDGTPIKGLPLAIQIVQRLVVLNLKNCKMLERLPICLGKLKFLEEIILSGCSRLKNLPDVRHSMKHVQILLFDGAGVDEIPNLSCFIGFDGNVSADISSQNFGSYSNPCVWPRGVSRVSSLRRLCLSGNDFVSLQNNIGQLYNLIWLDVKQCKKLTSVPMLPPRLKYFDAHGCDSLERVANPLALQVLTEQIHATYNFSNCNKLHQEATDAIISYTQWKGQLILDALSRYDGGFALQPLVGTCFPGWEVPTWFSYRASGSLLEPKLPPHWCNNRFTGIALCAVILFPAYQSHQNNLLVTCNCKLKNKDRSCSLFSFPIGGWSEPGEEIKSSHVFIGYTSELDIKKLREENEGCIHTEASFEFQVKNGTKEIKGCKVLKCGFSLVYESDDLQVNSGEHRATIDANQDITCFSWIQDFFGYIFLAFSCIIVLAILSFGVIVFAPQYYMSFSDFCWPLIVRILFLVAFGLFLKQ